jgi:glycosyltransferase involved in cell wall biosynthesis
MRTKSDKKRILFITPLGSRTGSEMMLLNIVQRLDRSKYEIAVASYQPGELLADMPDDVKVYQIPGTFDTYDRISYYLGRHPIAAALTRIQKEFNADLWYLNTIVLPKAAETAVALDVPFVVHFHEMPLSYVYVGREEFCLLLSKALHIIGCSEATCQGIREAGADRVSLVYSFIQDTERPRVEDEVAAIRRKFGVDPNHRVWMMSGVPSERKGFDYFPQLAEELNDETIHLLWVGGGGADDGYTCWVERKIAASQSKTKIHLAGRQKEMYDQYLHASDGFVLTSRQDPFPLVMIEAATLGKPIVSFPSGGVSELVEPGMGVVTEDFSVRQMAGAMRRVMREEVLFDPEIAKRKVFQYSIDEGMKAWNLVMDEILPKLD